MSSSSKKDEEEINLLGDYYKVRNWREMNKQRDFYKKKISELDSTIESQNEEIEELNSIINSKNEEIEELKNTKSTV